MLGGDGGDELFRARLQLVADLLRCAHPLRAVSLARELPGAGDSPSAPGDRQGHPIRSARRLARRARFDRLGRRAARRGLPGWLLAPSARDLLESERPGAWMALEGPRWWSYGAHGLTRGIEEIGIFEHQRLRARMAGLQARHPLFDLDLMATILELPARMSFDAHLNRPILRAAMQGMLPAAVRLRPAKAWFDSLIIDSLTGPDAASVRALLSSRSAELRSYAAMDQVIAMFDRGPGEGAARFAGCT